MNVDNLGYHPIRFGYQLEEFFTSFVSRWENARQSLPEKASGLLAGVMFEHEFADMIRDHAESLPPHIVEHADWWGPHLEHLVSAYKDYRIDDENIYHFSPDLIQSLSHATTHAIGYSDLHLPCSTFYMRFDTSMRPGGRKRIDGVYVNDYTDTEKGLDPAINLTFTSFTPGFDYRARILPVRFLTMDPTYSFFLMLGDGKTIAQAVASCLKEESQEEGWDSDTGLDWFPVVPELVALAMNCIAYISDHEDKIECAYPHYTPDALLSAVRKTTDQQSRDQALDDLEKLGYRLVNFCYVCNPDVQINASTSTNNTDESPP